MKNPDALQARAKALHLHGLLAHWPEAADAGWAASLIGWEEDERARRSLERRLQGAHIGRFKPLCDFDWGWPRSIDRSTFEALMTLDFLKDATNAVLVGPAGNRPVCHAFRCGERVARLRQPHADRAWRGHW
jgi:hypothetical protein